MGSRLLRKLPTPPDPLFQEVKSKVQLLSHNERGAYVSLVELGLNNLQTVGIDKFCEYLKDAELAAPRVSEIRTIVLHEKTARRFVSSDGKSGERPLGIREALMLARHGSKRDSSSDRDWKARVQIVKSLKRVIELMTAQTNYSIDCGLFRLKYTPLASAPPAVPASQPPPQPPVTAVGSFTLS